MSFFPQAFTIVIGEEGGYTNDPQDPGGETKFGISKRAYPNLDVAQLTLPEAQAIYRRDYWDKLNLDVLSWEMGLILFDAAVNQGPGFEHTLIGNSVEVMSARAVRYAENPNFTRFGKGWMHRLFNIFKLAQVTPK